MEKLQLTVETVPPAGSGPRNTRSPDHDLDTIATSCAALLVLLVAAAIR